MPCHCVVCDMSYCTGSVRRIQAISGFKHRAFDSKETYTGFSCLVVLSVKRVLLQL